MNKNNIKAIIFLGGSLVFGVLHGMDQKSFLVEASHNLNVKQVKEILGSNNCKKEEVTSALFAVLQPPFCVARYAQETEMEKQVEIIGLLIENGAKVKATDKNGNGVEYYANRSNWSYKLKEALGLLKISTTLVSNKITKKYSELIFEIDNIDN